MQECNIPNPDNRGTTSITAQVLYGHISIAQSANVGSSVKKGDQIAVLGASPAETDGERKHLHLGIIQGSSIDYRGYVSSQSELSKWINPEIYLGIIQL